MPKDKLIESPAHDLCGKAWSKCRCQFCAMLRDGVPALPMPRRAHGQTTSKLYAGTTPASTSRASYGDSASYHMGGAHDTRAGPRLTATTVIPPPASPGAL